MEQVGVRPPRGLLKNLSNGKEMEFLFNPQTLEEVIEAKYNRLQVPGLSHERLQYQNTTNNVIPLELFMSQLGQDKIYGQGQTRPYVATERKGFLESLLYPASNYDFGYQGPPRVLFVWPKMFRMQGRVTRVEFLHREFSSRTLATTVLVARVNFEADLDRRILMDDVLKGRMLTTEQE